MDNNFNGALMNVLLSSLFKKTIVPTDFHSQALAIKDLMDNDVSGLVDSLTDFQVNAANVRWEIKTGNDTLNSTMAKWLDTINIDFNGKVPSGINALASEYFKERWKGASFPILKILAWGEIDGYTLPTKLAFVDGSNVFADSNENEIVEAGDISYYLGNKFDSKHALNKGCIITKPFGRWFDEYPKIYLIKSGVYYNWKLLYSLKHKQSEILEQIMPYLLLVTKGTEGLALNKGVNYDNDKLQKVADQMQTLMEKMNEYDDKNTHSDKTPIRVSQFDEQIKHLIPDLGTILKAELGASFEKGILGGMGFIDIADAVSTSRRESILNPKAFIQEVYNGLGDIQAASGFAQCIKDLLFVIKKQNESRIKYSALDMKVFHSKPSAFVDKDFRDFMLSLYNRGNISKKAITEIIGDTVVYEYEVEQRKKEAKDGQEFFMYPPVVQNQEAAGGNDYLGSKNRDPEADMKTTEEKLSPDAKQKYNKASMDELEIAGYKSIAKLPGAVKEALTSKKEQRRWLATWNSAYAYYLGKTNDKKKAESMAFKTAWSQFKPIKDNING